MPTTNPPVMPIDLDAARPGIMDRLKTGTAERHHHAETRPLQRAMAEGTIDRDAWRVWAGQMLLVHRALERAVAELPAAGVPVPLVEAAVGHAERLAADVRALGGTPDAIEPLPAAAAVIAAIEAAAASADPAERTGLLGALYVLEGSMNGNRFLARRIAAAWGGTAGLSYLDPYGDEQRARWAAWRSEANALDLPDAADAAVVRQAEAMFDAIAALSDEVAATTRPQPAGGR